MASRSLVPEALDFLEPDGMSYEEWLLVGMAMHAEGMSAADWDAWSRRDPARHHPGECYRKWATFGNSPDTVTGGTVVQMARERGWRPRRDSDGADEAIGWDSPIVDASWIEPAEMPDADAPWDPAAEACRYLGYLFDAEDCVGYVTTAWKDDDGRWKPKGRGVYSRTAGELMADLRRTGSVEESLGTPDPDAGAWIRFNPLDGQGVKNTDVAEYRYALVESDEMELGMQKAMIDELELPCACVVSSGGKSLHAIVRVDAPDYAEYRRRVDFLYSVCKKNGLAVDEQNKNPSRLSRFPGFMRGGRRQEIVSGPCGKASWAEWREWVDEATDDLPDFESLADVWDDLPPLAEPLVDGVLRKGHKMMIAAASKTGKSYLAMALCVAIAEGGDWLGFKCARGHVVYANLELDRASCLHRFADVYRAYGVEPANVGAIDVWNLRGHATAMDRLVPSLVRRALKVRPAAIVLDPIYKVGMGDENSAEAVARFCNQLDAVAEAVGCSIVYVHHHSKGSQGSKASMDRASGSGVFARDADALLDVIELPVSDELRKVRQDASWTAAAASWLDANRPGWREQAGPDAAASRTQMNAFVQGLGRDAEEAVHALTSAAWERAGRDRAVRMEGTLREFPTFAPVNAWFSAPVYEVDRTGALADVRLEDEPMWKRGAKANRSGGAARRQSRAEKLDEAYGAVDMGGGVSVEDIAEYAGVGAKTVRGWIKENPAYWVRNGMVGRKSGREKD